MLNLVINKNRYITLYGSMSEVEESNTISFNIIDENKIMSDEVYANIMLSNDVSSSEETLPVSGNKFDIKDVTPGTMIKIKVLWITDEVEYSTNAIIMQLGEGSTSTPGGDITQNVRLLRKAFTDVKNDDGTIIFYNIYGTKVAEFETSGNVNLSNYYTKEEADEEFPKYDSIITVGEKSASVNTLFEDILTIWDGIFAELRNYCTVEKADETFIKSAEVITDGETSATVHTVLTDSLNLGSYAIRDDTLYYTSGKETNYYWNEIVDEVYKIASKADKSTIINYIGTEEVPTSITLENNTVYQFDVISELDIAYPEEITDSFEALIYFSSNETNINFIYPDGSALETNMSGQDCIDNTFAPVANKRYELSLKWDGKYMNGLVGAVSL